MLIHEIIGDESWVVRQSDSVREARLAMVSAGVRQLPVLDRDGRLVGVADLGRLLAEPENLPVAALELAPAVEIRSEAHVYEAASRMIESGADVLAVIGDSGILLGSITRPMLLACFALGLAVSRSGAVLEIEMGQRDYSVARLVHAIEQSDVKLLSLSSTVSDHVDGVSRITVKLDSTDASRIRHLLEHYGYKVTASYNESGNEEELDLRVREFFRYLEV